MNLSSKEKKYYENVFTKLKSDNQPLNERTCYKLIERGFDDPEICNKIKEMIFDNSRIKLLDEQGLYKMLKIIAALQNGYSIDEINVEKLPELVPPKLPKKSDKKSTTNPMSGSSLLSSGLTLMPEGEASVVKTSQTITNGSSDKENNTNNQNKANSKSEMEDTTIYKSFTREEVKHEEPKMSGSPNKNRMIEDLDADLIVPGKIEQVDIPNFTESVKIKNPKAIKNPFKNNNQRNIDDYDEEQKMEKILEEDNIILKNEETEGIEDKDDYEKMIAPDRAAKAKKRIPRNAQSVEKITYNDIIEKAQKIKIDIIDSVTHNSGYFGYGNYVAYTLKSKYSDTEIYEANRRFSDFDWLNSYFHSQFQYKGLAFPKLPEKKSLGTTESNFVSQRKNDLDLYLKELGRHPILSKDKYLRVFLGDESGQSFQSLKDSKTFGRALSELDWHKMKEAYEYVKASMKTKFAKEDPNFDWKDTNDKINEIFFVDESVSKLHKTIQKKEELHKATQFLSANLHIEYTKIMNRVSEEKYYSLGALSGIFVTETGLNADEMKIVEEFGRGVKSLKSRIDGLKESYGLLIGMLQEVSTYKELLKTKYGKTFEYQAENDQRKMDSANKDLEEINTKINTLYKEAGIARDNLVFEIDDFMEYFDLVLPVITNEYDLKLTEHFEYGIEASKDRFKC